MSIIKMAISLMVTLLIIIKVSNKKELIIPVCILYYIGSVIIDIFMAGAPLELGNAFGISYQWGDILLLIPFGVILIDIIKKPKVHKYNANAILTCIIALISLSMISGLVEFGLSSEWIGDFRTFFIFISVSIFFVRFDILKYIHKYIKLINICMDIILAISVILWILDLVFGFHPLMSQYNATLSDGGSTMRFIQPPQVLAIALYALYLIIKNTQENGTIGIRAGLFTIVVILFQHRSVWGALGAGVIVWIFCIYRTKKISLKLLLQGYLIIFLSINMILYSSSDVVENIRNSFTLFTNLLTGASLDNTTANTRFMVWNAVKSDLSGIATIIGRPFGYGYATSIGWETSPHGGYIRILGRAGYVGLMIIILGIIYLFIKAYRKNIRYIPAFLACCATYMYAYDFNWICGVILGCSIIILHKNSDNIRVNKESNIK